MLKSLKRVNRPAASPAYVARTGRAANSTQVLGFVPQPNLHAEPGTGSESVAEMVGHGVLTTEPLGGVRSLNEPWLAVVSGLELIQAHTAEVYEQ